MAKESSILIVDNEQDVLGDIATLLQGIFKSIQSTITINPYQNDIVNGRFNVILLNLGTLSKNKKQSNELAALKKIFQLNTEVIVVVMAEKPDIETAVMAMKHGAVDFIVKPYDPEKLQSMAKAALHLSYSNSSIARLRDTQKFSVKTSQPRSDKIIGESRVMKELFSTVSKVGKTDVNVLILGENGTGKEMVARLLHERSNRSGEQFITVDLGALPQSLFEPELFGHVKGAFTDAVEGRAGRFEIADEGTLFLDEITNLPPDLQSKLLRAIQQKEFTKVGDNKPIYVNARLISATNMPIHEMVEKKSFRQDLLYRLNTIEIHVPPLRDRGDDIFLLSNHFVKIYSSRYKKGKIVLSKEARKKLLDYYWPGNVRELQHVIERAVLMCGNKKIKESDLAIKDNGITNNNPRTLNLEELEKAAIKNALKLQKGNLSQAAKVLGLGRTTLYRKINKYNL
jgi:DNA-binding NtrC family response regulator